MQNSKYIKEVKDQYEDFPFPLRDPTEEKQRLLRPGCDNLGLLNHICFEGRQSFDNNFKVLVAGCGTGDSVV